MYLKIHIKYIKLCLKGKTVDNTVFLLKRKKQYVIVISRGINYEN